MSSFVLVQCTSSCPSTNAAEQLGRIHIWTTCRGSIEQSDRLVNGKAQERAMWVYRMVSAALLDHYLQDKSEEQFV